MCSPQITTALVNAKALTVRRPHHGIDGVGPQCWHNLPFIRPTVEPEPNVASRSATTPTSHPPLSLAARLHDAILSGCGDRRALKDTKKTRGTELELLIQKGDMCIFSCEANVSTEKTRRTVPFSECVGNVAQVRYCCAAAQP